MPAIVGDPNNMTKEKLKSELKKFNVPLPASDSKKGVLVKLYTDKILNAERLEFSSDEESVSATPKSTKKKLSSSKRSTPKKAASKESVSDAGSVDTSKMDVESMSDEELAAALSDLGVSAAITATTRKVYKRKLTKLLSEGGAPSPSSVETSSANSVKLKHDNSTLILSEFSDNDETSVKQVYTSVAESYSAPSVSSSRRRSARDSTAAAQLNRSDTRATPKRPPTASYIRDDVDSGFADSRESSSSGYLRSRESASSSGSGFLRNRAPEAGSSFRREPGADDWVGEETVTSRASRVSDIVTRARPQREETKEAEAAQRKWRVPIWAQLLLVLLIALVIWLVFQNMEPANKNPLME